MRGKSKISTKLNPWKEKAKQRGKKVHYLTRCVKDLRQSKKALKSKNRELNVANKILQKELGSAKRLKTTNVINHSYAAEAMQLCVQLRTQAGCSYRSCVQVLNILVVLLNLELKIPHFSSIRNWEIKLGYHELQETINTTDKWVLIIDESISIGNQKMLLLIGINLSKYQFGKALNLRDIQVLDIRLSKSWKAPDIEKVVKSVENRGFTFEYCCCDNGNNLRKLLKTIGLVHIEDCSHALGNWLKNRYKKEEVFLNFCTESTKTKRSLILSKYAEYVPPKHRTKGKFLNLSAIAVWAKKMLFSANKYQQTGTCKGAFEKIKWILKYEDFILKLNKEQTLINKINKLLKNNGLSKEIIITAKQIINQSSVEDSLKKYLLDYLERNKMKLPDLEKIICSSDIIESTFGKFKYNTSKSPNGAITEGCLSVANYGKYFEINEIKNAMEETRIVDIKKWRAENLPVSTQQKKGKLLKSAS